MINLGKARFEFRILAVKHVGFGKLICVSRGINSQECRCEL
jgi:hypothetical protein